MITESKCLKDWMMSRKGTNTDPCFVTITWRLLFVCLKYSILSISVLFNRAHCIVGGYCVADNSLCNGPYRCFYASVINLMWSKLVPRIVLYIGTLTSLYSSMYSHNDVCRHILAKYAWFHRIINIYIYDMGLYVCKDVFVILILSVELYFSSVCPLLNVNIYFITHYLFEILRLETWHICILQVFQIYHAYIFIYMFCNQFCNHVYIHM